MIEWRGLDAGRPQTDPDELPPLRRSSDPPAWRVALEVPFLLAFAAVIAVVVKALLAQAFFIPSASMEPQLTGGDRVVVSRMAYDLHDPRRGDIVVFDDPLDVDAPDRAFVLVRLGREALEAVGVVRPDDKELIKRVIGLPGESVSARGGIVHVDGRPLTEPYLPDGLVTGDFGPVAVPEGELFLMGDNRSNSKDGRVFGTVSVDSIVGRAIARVWPPVRVAFL